MTIYPVILCGGSGSRLWPASRPDRPKPFISLLGGRSTFQDAVLRMASLAGARRPLVVAGVAHGGWVRLNLQAIGHEADVLLEPEPRDSAAAVAAAAAWVAARDPQGVAVIVSADNDIPDTEAFLAAIGAAAAAARQGWIVTLGTHPTGPVTSFGYIAPAQPIVGAVCAVERFVEKPDRARAQTYVAAGYLWNSGNFIAQAQSLLDAFDQHAPKVGQAVRAGVADLAATPFGDRLGPAFRTAPKISFDYAIMEKTDRAAVLPASFAWRDLGTWDSILAAAVKDPAGNSVEGAAHLMETRNSVVRLSGEGPSITLLGLDGVVVAGDGEHLLIADLGSSQAVKRAAEAALAAPAPPGERLRRHFERFDPWLRTRALPVWATIAADEGDKGFFAAIGADGRPDRAAPVTAADQADLARAFFMAQRSEGAGPWREAGLHGLAALRAGFRRPDGLFAPHPAAQGAPRLEDQAKGLLALAALARTEPDPAGAIHEARGLLRAIEDSADLSGQAWGEAPDVAVRGPLALLEAGLAWATVDAAGVWDSLVARQAAHIQARRQATEAGYLAETRTPGDHRLRPAHQFLAARLLAQASATPGAQGALAIAEALFASGALAIDHRRGVVVAQLEGPGALTDSGAVMADQAAYLHAALCLARAAESPEAYLGHAAQAAQGLDGFLCDRPPALWRDRRSEAGDYPPGPIAAAGLATLVAAILALGEAVRAAP